MTAKIPPLRIESTANENDQLMPNRWDAAGQTTIDTPRPHQASAARPSAQLGGAPLTTITAFAGGGKSSLMSSWFAQSSRSAHEVSVWLDGEAAEMRGRPLAELLDLDLDADRLSAQRVVFIDHADHLAADDLEAVVRVAGPDNRFVIASRAELDVFFGIDTIRRVTAADLRMSDHQVRNHLTAVGPGLSERALTVLTARLGGWGAGVGIVSNILSNVDDAEQFAQDFTGRDRDVVDYFETEVMAGLDAEDRSFLIQTSVLGAPEGAASDVLLGTRWSHERLVRLAASGNLVTATPKGTFAWTPLARDFLLMRLEQSNVADRQEGHRRLLEHFRSQGRHSAAIAQAFELGSDECVAEIAGIAGLSMAAGVANSSVIAWLDGAPANIIKHHPEVAVSASVALWFDNGDSAAPLIHDWLSFAESTQSTSTVTDAVSMASSISATRAAFVLADPATRLEQAERAFATEGPANTSWAALAAAAAGVSCYLADDPKTARTWFADSLRIASALEGGVEHWSSRMITGLAFATLALIEADRGEFVRSETYIAAGDFSRAQHGAEPIGGGVAPLGRAIHDINRADPASTQQGLELLHLVAASAKFEHFGILAQLEIVRVLESGGNSDEAVIALADVRRRIEQLDGPGRLIERRLAAIERLLEQRRPTPSDVPESELTQREEEVLHLLDSDLTRREIGEQLYLAHNTVKTYVQRLYQKLGVSSRPAAIAAARARGWI